MKGNVKITAIILAAGKGTRMNSDVYKQYMIIHEKPVLYYSLKAFSDSTVSEIIVVTGEAERESVKEDIIKRYGFSKVSAVVAGGKARYDSTYAGLKACTNTDYVLIHDAARPMINKELIERTIETVLECDAVVVGVHTKDTIKVTDKNNFVSETPIREFVWVVQTPQAFSYALIRKAYEDMIEDIEERKAIVTDDATVMEMYGTKAVKMVPGDYLNIKITTREDILFAEQFLKMM